MATWLILRVTQTTSKQMDFEILLDDIFTLLTLDKILTPTENKNVLSIVNDSEDASWWYDKFQKFIRNNIKKKRL